jgi:hypothetical protein
VKEMNHQMRALFVVVLFVCCLFVGVCLWVFGCAGVVWLVRLHARSRGHPHVCVSV